jgi:hypothetical protein
MQQYVDDVRLRLSRYDISAEVDNGMLEMLVNRARHDVQLATLWVFPERYARETTIAAAPSAVANYATTSPTLAGSVTNAVYEVALPSDFIEEVQVFIKDDSTNFWAARKLNKRELFQIMRNVWNCPTLQNPIYYVERSPGDATYTIGASKGATAVATNDIKLWYLAKLPYLQLFGTGGAADPEVRIGYDCQELVVTLATLKTCQALQFSDALPTITGDIDLNIYILEEMYKKRVDRSKLLLPSRESLYPNMPVPERPAQPMVPQQ